MWRIRSWRNVTECPTACIVTRQVSRSASSCSFLQKKGVFYKNNNAVVERT